MQGCELTTVNIYNFAFVEEYGSFLWGEGLDVIVNIGSGCAALGVTTEVGDWFKWSSFQDKTAMIRVGNCNGDYRELPLPCRSLSYFDRECSTDEDCDYGAECL